MALEFQETYTGSATQTQQTIEKKESPEQMYDRLYGQVKQLAERPVQATLPPELSEEIKAMRVELASLKKNDTQPPAGKRAPAWIEKIREGDLEGADAEVLHSVEQRLADRFKKVQEEAYQQALSATQVNLEIDRHVQKIKVENPDIVQFEKYLQAPVAQRVEEAKAAGRVKTPNDFVREYKAAVDAEVEEIRNRVLVLRGKGKDEANTRNQQVLATSVLEPNQIKSTEQQSNSKQQLPDVSVDSYFAARRADENRRRGLSI